MIETKMVWHDATKELPEKSCEVLIIVDGHNAIMNVDFSNKYKAFNVSDFFANAETAIDDVVAWAYYDDAVKEVKGELL